MGEILLYSDLLTLHNTLNSTWPPSKTNSVNLTRRDTATTPTQWRFLIGCMQTHNPPPHVNDCTNSRSITPRPTKLGWVDEQQTISQASTRYVNRWNAKHYFRKLLVYRQTLSFEPFTRQQANELEIKNDSFKRITQCILKRFFFGARSKHIKISSDSYPCPKVILDVAKPIVFFHLTLHRTDGGVYPCRLLVRHRKSIYEYKKKSRNHLLTRLIYIKSPCFWYIHG